jgi:hypothetical protein
MLFIISQGFLQSNVGGHGAGHGVGTAGSVLIGGIVLTGAPPIYGWLQEPYVLPLTHLFGSAGFSIPSSLRILSIEVRIFISVVRIREGVLILSIDS